MEYRPLGRTGVQVSALCLGAMMFGEWGTKDHDESIRIIHRALDAGINFVDTADVYSHGESEEIVGEALRGRRDDIVVATKVHMPMGADPNRRGNGRRWIVTAVENSLRRLGTDWIDVYQVHRYDPAIDLEVTLGALSDLVHAGKIRHFGHSTWPISAIVEAQWTAERRGLERPWTEQPPYSILTRGVENDALPTLARYGYGVLSYSPLAGGWLSGRYSQGSQAGPAASSRPQNRFDLSLPDNQYPLQRTGVRRALGTARIGRQYCRRPRRQTPSRFCRTGCNLSRRNTPPLFYGPIRGCVPSRASCLHRSRRRRANFPLHRCGRYRV